MARVANRRAARRGMLMNDLRATSVAMRADDGVDDGEEVARNENVGERAKKRAERVIVARRVSELLRTNLVRSSSDWNRADRGEIRLGVPYGAVGVIAGVG